MTLDRPHSPGGCLVRGRPVRPQPVDLGHPAAILAALDRAHVLPGDQDAEHPGYLPLAAQLAPRRYRDWFGDAHRFGGHGSAPL